MKHAFKVAVSIFCLFLMLNMTTIEADNNSLIIIADLKVLNNRTTAYLGEEIQFDANSTQGPWQSLVFYFHDGTDPLVTSQTLVSHSFNIEGKFLVTLMAVGVGSTSDSATIEITIINEQPSAKIFMPSSAKEDENVTLRAIDIQDTPNDIDHLRFRWVLGDGNIKEGAEINHAWVYSGTYTVTLQILDEHLAMSYVTSEITITNTPPVANFDILDSNENYITPVGAIYMVTEEDLLDFDATSTQDSVSDYETLQFYWDFGDGSVGRGGKIHHAYHESGTYNVTLLAVDDDGASSSLTQVVEVQNIAPTINIMSEDLILQEGQTYLFETESQDTSTDFQRLLYSWSFGGTGWRQSHVWSDDWSGNVSVDVQDPEGAIATDSISVQVLNVPPSIQIDSAYLNTNLTITLSGYSGQRFEVNIYNNGILMTNLSGIITEGLYSPITRRIPINFDISQSYQVEIKYSTGVTPIGKSYATLTYSFSDNTCYSLSHTFTSGHWDPWVTNPANIYPYAPITFNGNIFDPGMDDINALIQLQTHIDIEIDFFLAFLLNILGLFPFSCEIDITDDTHVQVDGWMTDDDIIHISIEGTTNLSRITYDNEGVWPVNLPLSVITRIPKLDFLSVIDLVNIELFGMTILNIDITRADTSFQAYVEDDDGGSTSLNLNMLNLGGSLYVQNLAPHFEFSVPEIIYEDMTTTFVSLYQGSYPLESLQYNWSFGDGSSSTDQTPSHAFPRSGDYLIQFTITDPTGLSTTHGRVIQVKNYVPIVNILGVSTGAEDDSLKFTAQVDDTTSDLSDLRYFWTFGDGNVGIDPEIFHSYAQSGIYTLELTVRDDNGAFGTQTTEISINDEPPIFDGPFGFTINEGYTIIANPKVYDSTVDEPNLIFQWLYGSSSSNSRIFSTKEDDGAYIATLSIFDSPGNSITNDINLTFINQPPVITASDLMLYGAPGTLMLKAFALDSYSDTPDLTYEWFIDGETIPDGQGLSSQVAFEVTETRTYNGFVTVRDDSNYGVSSEFSVIGVLDTDGDGLTNEIEQIYTTNPNLTDSDGDYLPDSYEIEHSKTNPNAWDSDNDGFCDGLDPTPGIMTGETIFGTDPSNPDTDGDGLQDGEEIIGWTIQVREWIDGWDPEDPDQTKPRHVQSNPLLLDTDSDGLNDSQEVIYGLDPERPDTDGDGKTDPEEIHQGAAFDSDKDGLSDTLEETPIIIYVPEEYSYTLNSESTPSSSWSNALELKGTLEDTLTDDEHPWVGQSIDKNSPQIITFTGVFNSITTQYNTFLVHLNITGDEEAPAFFQVWDGSTWKTLTTFDTTTTEYVRFITDETNATQWIQSGTLQFRITSGYNIQQKDITLQFVSYIEIIFAQMVGIIKYTLNPAMCSWTNTQEGEGNLANTRNDDITSWMGWKTVSESPQQVIFEGGFNGITTANNRLTVRLRVSADYTNAYFQILDGETWIDYRTFSESTTEYVVIQIDENTNPSWIQEGTLRFRIISGSDMKSFNSQNEYQGYIEVFYAAIEEIRTEETTLSDSSLPDTDNDGLSDWEEYYPGADGFVTNPRNNDTDSDGLIDSAESVSLTREYGQRERFTRKNLLDDNWGYFQGGKFIYSTSQQFHFDAIINGGNAKNATVFVGFSSSTDLQINLVKIEVAGRTVVEEQNPALEEPEGGLDGTYFFKGYDITTKTTAFSGEWRLTIDAKPLRPGDFDLGDEYSVLLEEFKAEVVLPLNPTKADWDKDGLLDGTEMNAAIAGWITNPRTWDSDGDFLSDREEIFKLHTNPLSIDTDGDGVTDRLDHDPLFNLIINITVQKAQDVGALFTPLLAVVMKVDGKAIATRPVWASEDGHRTSVFNWNYFFDVPDDQSSVQIGIELWWMNPIWWLWDNQLLSMGYEYAVGTGGDPKSTPPLTLKNVNGYWVKFQVSTLALKRVNTLAIYSEGNFFDGHYPALERFVVITLGVKEDGGPFLKGVNTILIPVSLFTRTELHSKWENNKLPAALTEDSTSGIAADFYGLDSGAETISQHVEGLIEKGLKTKDGDCVTVAEALAILDSLLKNETGQVIYAYFRCDTVGEVERLGLAEDILDLVADDAQALTMGPTGGSPKGFVDWLISGFLFFVTLMVLAALSPFLLLGLLVAALISIGITLIGPLFLAFVLLLLKIIILIFIYIMLALALLGTLIAFLALLVFLLITTKDHPEQFSCGFLWFELNSPNGNARFEITVVDGHSSFLDLTFPCIKIATYQNNQIISGLILSFGLPIEGETVILNSENLQNSENSENLIQSYTETISVDNDAFNEGMWIAFFIYGIFMMLISIAPSFVPLIILGISIGVIIATWYFKASSEPSLEARKGFTSGFGFGLIKGGLQMIAPMLPGFIIQDLAYWVPISRVIQWQIQIQLIPEYEVDPGVSVSYDLFSLATTYIWNTLVERDVSSYKRWAWEALAFFNFLFGLFLLQYFNFIPIV